MRCYFVVSGQSQIGQSQTEELISPLILLAEDNEANIATFTSYLEAKGYCILLATDGQQAIATLKTIQTENRNPTDSEKFILSE